MTAGVFEYIVEATGAPTGPLDCMVTGVCTKGKIGAPYLISKRSDIKGMLGIGPMVDRIYDIFQEDTGELGRDINLVVVPVEAKSLPPLPPMTRTGSDSGPDITITGSQAIGMKLVIRIDQSGKVDTGQFNYSIDGGHNFESSSSITIPSTFDIPNSIDDDPDSTAKVTIHFGSDEYLQGDTYKGTIAPPTADTDIVIKTIKPVLETYDVKRIFITGPSDLDDWNMMGKLADDLFADHRPASVVAEFRGTGMDEHINDWASFTHDTEVNASGIVEQRKAYNHPYVDVVAAEGEVLCKDLKTRNKVLAGLYVGRTLSIKTNRHIGRVRSGKIRGLSSISPNYQAIQPILETTGLITVTSFAGLSGYYWGDDRTLAESTSNFKSVRTRETVFKALRIARAVALQYIREEAGSLSGATGLSALKADIESAIFNAMIGPSSEQEMRGIIVTIPPGQDPEKGVDVELDLLGIASIQKISLYAKYSTAGASISEAA